MKALLKSLTVLALLLALITGASAAWNIRHNADGTSDFVRDRVNAVDEFAVGTVVLNVFFEDIAESASIAVAIPITNAQVSYIQGVLSGSITTADTLVHFSTYRGTSVIGQLTDTTPGTNNRTMEFSVGNNGAVLGQTFSFLPLTATTANMLHKGDSIVLFSDGGATPSGATTTKAMFTIVVEPR